MDGLSEKAYPTIKEKNPCVLFEVRCETRLFFMKVHPLDHVCEDVFHDWECRVPGCLSVGIFYPSSYKGTLQDTYEQSK